MRTYGLVGKHLDHSWSEEYFRQKFLKEGLSGCVYRNFSLPNLMDFREFIRKIKDLQGLNITIPYKVEVIEFMDELDPVAASVGAVNCIKITRTGNHTRLIGYNTDAIAFRETLIPLLKDEQLQALVLGTGGSAKAVHYALKEFDITTTLVSRSGRPGALAYSDLDKRIIAEHLVIINATPVGMYPNAGNHPQIPYEALTGNHLLYDLVYNPEVTLFLKKGCEAGARTKNGLEMLQLQADLSWKIWN